MSTLNELMKYGIDTLSYLIPRNERITTSEFAALIRKHTDSPRAGQIAMEFQKVSGILDRRWDGTRFEPENEETKREIVARNAGFRVVRHPAYPHDSGHYAIVTREGADAKVFPGAFASLKDAWTAAYNTLGFPFEIRRFDSDKVDSVYSTRSQAKGALDEIDRASPMSFYGMDTGSGDRFLSFAAVTALLKDGKTEQAYVVSSSDGDMLAEQGHATESTEGVTFFGTITADQNDRRILEGLGVVIGHGAETSRDGGNEFTVMVSEQALRELDPYWGSFTWQLLPLPHTVKPADAALKAIPFRDMSDEQLQAYDAYLLFKLDQAGNAGDATNRVAGPADGTDDFVLEMAGLKEERDRRLMPEPGLRVVPNLTHSIEI